MFNYTSSQVHNVVENGRQMTKKNIVNIENGKGVKTVEVTQNGKTRKSTKKLTNAEIQKIQKNQFIPGLFKPCYNCINTRQALRQASRQTTNQTRRNSKKKGESRK
jgi:hypothetical protein